MGKLTMWIGIIWGVLGIGNVLMGAAEPGFKQFGSIVLIFNMIVFILPGLIVMALGSMMSRKKNNA